MSSLIAWIIKRIKQVNYKKIEERKAYFPFTENIWGTDLADIQLISKYYNGIWF